MRYTFIAALLFLSSGLVNAVPASAITVKNIDKDAHTVIITERGVRTEQLIAGGGQATFCADGCFMRFPDGQMQVFKGGETVTIQNRIGRLTN